MAAAESRPLRAVSDDEKPAKPRRARRKTLAEAINNGTPREILIARRHAVVSKMKDCHPRDLAQLDRRLESITAEIAAIDAQGEEEAGGGAATPDEEWEAI